MSTISTPWRCAASAFLAAGILAAATATPASAAPIPETLDEAADIAPPPGSNEWDCRPSQRHPRPVVLVHGTWGNRSAWNVLSPNLKAEGYCVFALNYGRDTSSLVGAMPGKYGTGDIRESARELARFVDRVRGATGVEQVDMVGFSQGSVTARQFLRFEGGADEVATMVLIAGPNHGTTLSGLGGELPAELLERVRDIAVDRVAGVALPQQFVGSDFITTLNAGGDTEPGVAYTVIASHADTVSTPPEATFLTAGPGATVRNLWVQDLCVSDTAGHGDMPKSPTVGYLVQAALDSGYSGDPCPGA